MKKTIVLSILSLTALCAGCAALNPQPPIEAVANKFVDQAIVPAVREGIAQGIRSMNLQAGAHGINPTYKVTAEGKWVVGLEVEATIGVDGVAGQLQITAAGDDETENSPANTTFVPAPPDGQ